MKRAAYLVLIFVLASAIFCFAEKNFLLIDDFEVSISGGPTGTVDFGAGNGSTLEVSASTDIKQTGQQAIRIDFDAVEGGYIWVARGKGLDAKNSAWLINPEDVRWDKYNGISFYMY